MLQLWINWVDLIKAPKGVSQVYYKEYTNPDLHMRKNEWWVVELEQHTAQHTKAAGRATDHTSTRNRNREQMQNTTQRPKQQNAEAIA
jgi:hypothetical protein